MSIIFILGLGVVLLLFTFVNLYPVVLFVSHHMGDIIEGGGIVVFKVLTTPTGCTRKFVRCYVPYL